MRGGAVRRLADEDAVDRRRRLEARRRVDDVSRDHRLAGCDARAARDERLAAVHGDPYVDLRLRQRVADREGCAHCPLGVVLVGDWRAEDGHHRVADELLDRAAVALELAAHPSVVRRQGRADILRVEELRLRGRADQVGEEDRHNLALLEEQLGGRVERRAAAGAEGNAVRALPPAGRADDHFRITVEAFPKAAKAVKPSGWASRGQTWHRGYRKRCKRPWAVKDSNLRPWD